MYRNRFLPIVVLLTLLISLVPVSPVVHAKHCDALEQQVKRLQKEVAALELELGRAEEKLDRESRDVLDYMKEIGWLLNFMPELGDNARSELKHEFGKDFAAEVATSILIMVVAPEYLPANLVAAINLIDSLSDAYEMIKALQDSIAIMNEMFSLGGSGESLAEAQKFATDNDLPQLKRLIDAYARLPVMQKGLEKQWDEWFNAGINVESLKSLLDAKRVELQAAADALDKCVQEDEAEPEPCPTHDPNNPGIGQCR